MNIDITTGSSQFLFKNWLLTAFAAAASLGVQLTAHAHVTLDQNVALSGTSFKAALRVGHGCQGSPTREIRVTIPDNFQGAKPMPKPGWALSIERAVLAKPYQDHGKEVREDVRQITWRATAPEHFLADAHYDEFVLRGRIAQAEGAMWFKVLQTCEKGEWRWEEVPAQGTSTKGVKAPAALLEILPAGKAGDHQH
jgi:uncharacterized protein YcnI